MLGSAGLGGAGREELRELREVLLAERFVIGRQGARVDRVQHLREGEPAPVHRL